MLWVLVNPDTGRLLANGRRFESKTEAEHIGHTECDEWEVVSWPAYCKKHPSRR